MSNRHTLSMSLNSVQVLNLKNAAKAALSTELEFGVPRPLTIAQWALESGWGLLQPGNNCFGIKQYPGCYGIQMRDTWEEVNGIKQPARLAFATFPNLSACFRKRGELITKGAPYRRAWQQYVHDRDLDTLIENVAFIYATDSQYAAKVKRIINMPQVQEALEYLSEEPSRQSLSA